MQLAALARWIKRDSRPWEGRLSMIRAEGTGRDIMLIHGLAASHACWDDLRNRIGPKHRVHTVQMRGFAGAKPPTARPAGGYLKAMADELAGYIRQSGRAPIAVCGHSMGGIVALIMTRDHPDVVDRLMVVDVPSFFSVLINPFATEATFSAFAEATRRSYMDRAPEDLEDDLRRTARRLVTDPVALERVIEWGIDSDQALTADVMAEVMTTDLRPDMSSIDRPTDVLYAWDRGAPTTRVGLDQLYGSAYSNLADCQRIRIDDARHYIMLDQPEAFHQSVRDWLAR